MKNILAVTLASALLATAATFTLSAPANACTSENPRCIYGLPMWAIKALNADTGYDSGDSGAE